MIRAVRKLIMFYGFVILFIMVSTIVGEFNGFNEAKTEMDSLVRRGNRYCTQQSQDLDIVREQINSNLGSSNAYLIWLNAIGDYNCIKGLSVNGGTTKYTLSSPGIGEDNTVTRDIIPFLKDDFLEDKKYGYTPLNFGMTYLDPVKLEEDMKFYLYKSITEYNQNIGLSRSGLYIVDPNTLEVEVELDVTPVRIDSLLDTESKEAYMSMFGTSIPAETGDNKSVTRSEIKTIIKYDIVYKVYWDYVPHTPFFRLSSREASKRVNGTEPDNTVYFPKLYDKRGNNTGNYNDAVAKWYPSEPLEYRFEYILTH